MEKIAPQSKTNTHITPTPRSLQQWISPSTAGSTPSSSGTGATRPTNTPFLRGVIEICQQSSHLREDDGDQVSFPLGLLVEKWLLYYYPIFAAPTFIPQKNGETPEQDAGRVRRLSTSPRNAPISSTSGGTKHGLSSLPLL